MRTVTGRACVGQSTFSGRHPEILTQRIYVENALAMEFRIAVRSTGQPGFIDKPIPTDL